MRWDGTSDLEKRVVADGASCVVRCGAVRCGAVRGAGGRQSTETETETDPPSRC